jgi:hypothetical protein
MLAQQYVRLGQAGDQDEDKLALHEIGIDLPAQVRTAGLEREEVTAARHIIEQGERILDIAAKDRSPHLLLIGGPGQGKSTLSQLVCQCYRIALLREAPLSPEAQRLLNRLVGHFNEILIDSWVCRLRPLRLIYCSYGIERATLDT